jgi:hypothetical protein
MAVGKIAVADIFLKKEKGKSFLPSGPNQGYFSTCMIRV